MTAAVPEAALRRLFAVLGRRVAPRPGDTSAIAAERRRVAARLGRVEGRPMPLPPAAGGHPSTRFLAAAIARLAPRDRDLAELLGAIGSRLPWRYGYAPTADRPGLETRMGWAEIVGPAAPFVADDVCLGLTLIGPDTDYAAHRHPAIELYDVVAGHPSWTVAGVTFTPGPGDAVLHESDVVHAMRTTVEPLLAVYSWTGDVVSPSVWAADRDEG